MRTLLPMALPRTAPVGELVDGTVLRVRPLVPRDRAALAERFRRLSPDTRYARFLHPVERLSPADLDLLVDSVDGETHVALVLEAVRVATDGRGAVTGIEVAGVGVGRYVRWPDRPDAADVAFTVDDAWHGRGCGRALGAALAGHARTEGVRVFTADVLADNAACLRLLAGLGRLTRLGSDGGVVHVEVALAEPARCAA
jgi:GNAT superfamily N-acetyltransferase